MPSSTPKLARFAWATLAYNVLVILWGAFVRATGSGAGCGAHWPLCNGEIVPQSPTTATLIELAHRITSSSAGLLAIVLVVCAWRAAPKGASVRRAAAWVLFLEITEGAVGASIVLLRYVGTDASAPRAIWVAAHLTNTFFLLVALVITALRASGIGPSNVPAPPSRRALVTLAVGLSIVVGMAGAITALGDTLFPATSLASGMADDLSPTAHFLVRLRVIHPILATGTALVLAGIAGTATLGAPSPLLRRAAIAVVITQLAQIGCGVLNLVLLAPVAMQMLHLLFADFAWIALIVFADRFLAEPARLPSRSLQDVGEPDAGLGGR
jgi:cytochrome c oxidase assembly protein subunit 15